MFNILYFITTEIQQVCLDTGKLLISLKEIRRNLDYPSESLQWGICKQTDGLHRLRYQTRVLLIARENFSSIHSHS